MRDIIKYGIVLMIITAVSASLLSFIFRATEERRRQIVLRERREALEAVLPGASIFEENNGYYTGYPGEDREQPAGYAFIARGEGYSGVIETMVGITPGGEITGIRILSQQETPGLGSRVEEVPPSRTLMGIIMGRDENKEPGPAAPWFQKQFAGKSPEELTPDRLEAITGATITTDAVINSVREGIENLLVKINGEG